MTVEPMTDAALTKLSKHLLEYAGRDVFGLYAQDMRRVLARLDAERSRADAVLATISTLTAERDAAVARAMPEPRLMRTVEEVEALPNGWYRAFFPIDTPWAKWTTIEAVRPKPDYLSRLWLCRSHRRTNADLVGAWISGPLPDLPTPTAGETL